MDRRLNILYRGPLSSCNYGCEYCPFAKRHETAVELRYDRECLQRFVDWLGGQRHRNHGVFFTPWGEALTRRWYRDAVVALSQMDHVMRVAVQTNLSCDLGWLRQADANRVALWCTYHPGETRRADFLEQCAQLDEMSVAYSVGVVGLKEHQAELKQLRAALSNEIYLWVNAYKRLDDYYSQELREQIQAIDPLFPYNAVRHASLGKACNTGETAITVDGKGEVRRCHFVDEVIGNIYQPDWEACLRPRACPNTTCGCHIGYVHMPSLNLQQVYGDNILERIPKW